MPKRSDPIAPSDDKPMDTPTPETDFPVEQEDDEKREPNEQTKAAMERSRKQMAEKEAASKQNPIGSNKEGETVRRLRLKYGANIADFDNAQVLGAWNAWQGADDNIDLDVSDPEGKFVDVVRNYAFKKDEKDAKK